MNVLVTGGAGYIGSFMVKRLLQDGIDVVVIDNLSRGHKEAVDQRATLLIGDISDGGFVDKMFNTHQIEAVIHFAAYISMGESMERPNMYFTNNTFGSLAFLEKMRENQIKKIIFSSTAGVYGSPEVSPIPEDHLKAPTNPYGESKRMVERILRWYQVIHGITFVSLRYFNASGAALDGSLGEQHDPETHLIPNAIKAALENRDFTLFGNDYQTEDGTCVRDYIHVLDLVEAHMLALKKLESETGAFSYNVGAGKGYSNKQVLDEIKKITGRDVRVKIASRRPGDVETLVADTKRIQDQLHFQPKYSDLETIVRSAWEYHKRNVK